MLDGGLPENYTSVGYSVPLNGILEYPAKYFVPYLGPRRKKMKKRDKTRFDLHRMLIEPPMQQS